MILSRWITQEQKIAWIVEGQEWTPGVGDGQGGLACCDSWGRKESDTTERLNWTEEKVTEDHPNLRSRKTTWALKQTKKKYLEKWYAATEIEKWLKRHYTLFLNLPKKGKRNIMMTNLKSDLGKKDFLKEIKVWVSVNGTGQKPQKTGYWIRIGKHLWRW